MVNRFQTSGRLGAALLSLAVVAVSSMPVRAGYVPPDDARPPDARTSSSGGRHCGASQDGLRLTAMAPQSHVGQTVSSHPTFVWFVPAARPLSGELQIWELSEAGVHRILKTAHTFSSTQGFMSFTLPESVDGLQPNKDYAWQVLLRCGRRLSEVSRVRTQITVVSDAERSLPPPETSQLEQAEQYARVGLWYDAFGLVSIEPLDDAAETFRRSLLQDLAELEASSEDPADPGDAGGLLYEEILKRIAE